MAVKAATNMGNLVTRQLRPTGEGLGVQPLGLAARGLLVMEEIYKDDSNHATPSCVTVTSCLMR